jgi:hypothetical protein
MTDVDAHRPGTDPAGAFVEPDRSIEMASDVEDRLKTMRNCRDRGAVDERARNALPARHGRDHQPGDHGELIWRPVGGLAGQGHDLCGAAGIENNVADDPVCLLGDPRANGTR